MPLHLIKLSVGIDDVDHLVRVQARRLGETGRLFHRTRMMPRRAAEIVCGGSIYWVIRGLVRARQPVTAIERAHDEDGRSATLLLLAPGLIRTVPRPQRAFQGWRYLAAEDAPADLEAGGRGDGLAEMPPALRAELRALGLL